MVRVACERDFMGRFCGPPVDQFVAIILVLVVPAIYAWWIEL